MYLLMKKSIATYTSSNPVNQTQKIQFNQDRKAQTKADSFDTTNKGKGKKATLQISK